MENFYVWIIITFFVGIFVGFLVSHFSIRKDYFKLKREYKKYKSDLARVLDAHAKEGLPMSYDEVKHFLEERKN